MDFLRFLRSLLEPSGLTPHGFCLLWQPGLILLHAVSDGAIALAYFTIPAALAVFAVRRKDLAFGWIYLVFAAFILLCGVTHVMSVVTLWVPAYGAEGLLKGMTACVSIGASVLIWTMLPKALALPSPQTLRDANAMLSFRIAESENAQRRLRLSEARQRTIFLGLPAALYSLDPEGRVTEANDYTADLIGLTRERLIGRPITDFVPALQVEAYHDAMALTLRAGETREIESRFLHASGRIIDVLVSSRAQAGHDGRAEHVLSVVTDVTARRQAEAALRDSEDRLRQSQKMEAIGKLTGGIAHDFNNMLTVIEGNLERLADHLQRDERGSLLVGQAALAARRADTLIEQLLAFSRRQKLDPHPIDARDVLGGLHSLVERVIGEQIALVVEHDASPWLCLADRNQFEAGLLNLAINASQAVREKGITDGQVRISTSRITISAGDGWRDGGGETPEPGDYVRIRVADNGVGMSDDVRSRALDPFFTTKPTGQGSGLGLSQTYGFVRQSHGAMRIESVPGRGSTVEILLPRAARDSAASFADPVPTALVDDPRPAALGRELLLVVEDEPAVLEIAASSLRESGFRVVVAADAQAALSELAANPEVALVFTDIVMPGQTGVALAAEVWKIRPGLPVIFASGYSEEALAHQLPPDACFIKKPYRISAVIAAIRSALAESTEATLLAAEA